MGSLSLTKVLNPHPGWYRGDFHLHTNQSDGRYTAPELARHAREHGLDFFAITDHNTLDAFEKFGDNPGVLVIPGVEITLVEGHWNVFGMEGWRDWMAEIVPGRICVPFQGPYASITALMEAIAGEGLLNSINHPLLKPWEWRDGVTAMQNVHCLEIVNDPLWPDNRTGNPLAIALWTAALNAGQRITAVGGSDFHFFPGDTEYPGEYPGLPSTWVYVGQLSAAGILDGLRQRRVYVSHGPRLTFKAFHAGREFMIGDDLGPVSGIVRFEAVVGPPVTPGDARAGKLDSPDFPDACSLNDASARLVCSGMRLAEVPLQEGRAELVVQADLSPDRPAWYRLDVLDAQGQFLAVTNPIFAGPGAPVGRDAFIDYAAQALSSGNA
jgi:hypothetical protein